MANIIHRFPAHIHPQDVQFVSQQQTTKSVKKKEAHRRMNESPLKKCCRMPLSFWQISLKYVLLDSLLSNSNETFYYMITSIYLRQSNEIPNIRIHLRMSPANVYIYRIFKFCCIRCDLFGN